MRVPVPDARFLFGDGDHESESTGSEASGVKRPRLCAKVAGFSLHAGRFVHASDRDGLERLCRYGLRAPFSQERLSLAEDGRVIYRLARPWPDSAGVTQLVLEGTELLARLAALVPAPYLNMIRYHSVFASRSKWRSRLPAPAERRVGGEEPAAPSSAPSSGGAETGTPPPTAPSPPPCRRLRIPWAVLLARVLYLDALLCVKCGGKRKVLAFLTDPQVVKKILSHLGLETAPLPLAPARVGERELRLWPWDESETEVEAEASGRGSWEEDSGEREWERGPP